MVNSAATVPYYFDFHCTENSDCQIHWIKKYSSSNLQKQPTVQVASFRKACTRTYHHSTSSSMGVHFSPVAS